MSGPRERSRGRPMGFDRATALEEAMKLFWEHGYEGTSFDELTTAMRISPSSFYNAFGSKERLYREATAHFISLSVAWIRGALWDGGGDTRGAVAALLDKVATEFTHDDLPRGCMVSVSGTHQAAELAPIGEMMTGYRLATETILAERIRDGIAAGDMPADCDVEGLSALVNTLIRGLAVQARDGASRERLAGISRLALAGWPSAPREG